MKANKRIKEILVNLAYDGYTEKDAVDFIKRCYSENVDIITLNEAKKVKDFS